VIGLGVDHQDLVDKVKRNGKSGQEQPKEPAKYYGGRHARVDVNNQVFMMRSFSSKNYSKVRVRIVHRYKELTVFPSRVSMLPAMVNLLN